MRYLREQVLTAADATQATQTSIAFDLSYAVAVSCIGIAAGGTITGTLKIQVSNDKINPTNWVDSGSSVSVTGAGNFLIPKFDVSYMWGQVVYTKTTSAAGALITAIIKTDGF